MGVRNYLIEGLSGAGKTTVAEELQRRGHHVIHGDRQFAYYGDPETGAPLDWPAFDSENDKVAWGYRHWIWPVERVKALIADRSHLISFFCGGSRNRHHFIALFDRVFVLEADAATLNRRLAARPADVFGGKPIERAFNTRLHASGDNDPGNAIRIDATAPLADVVDAILAACQPQSGG
ncbi:AAA family ATPase [Devosia sp. Root105]|uniref:AAA family ATPase n=1 Tax=Devosia sp. Root105 TaxID=1736423 RepID=UPI0006FA134E|nr:AAA family ATPase [Devosia sp. Root105]KQU95283.1 nucleoside kinase [Devosia sp. Root105]